MVWFVEIEPKLAPNQKNRFVRKAAPLIGTAQNVGTHGRGLAPIAMKSLSWFRRRLCNKRQGNFWPRPNLSGTWQTLSKSPLVRHWWPEVIGPFPKVQTPAAETQNERKCGCWWDFFWFAVFFWRIISNVGFLQKALPSLPVGAKQIFSKNYFPVLRLEAGKTVLSYQKFDFFFAFRLCEQ